MQPSSLFRGRDVKVYEIPLQAKNQRLSVTLRGVVYRLAVNWRNAAATWFLDIADGNGNPLLQGLALVSGCDLLHQHQEVGLGGQLVVALDAGTLAPTFDNLGSAAHVLFVTP